MKKSELPEWYFYSTKPEGDIPCEGCCFDGIDCLESSPLQVNLRETHGHCTAKGHVYVKHETSQMKRQTPKYQTNKDAWIAQNRLLKEEYVEPKQTYMK